MTGPFGATLGTIRRPAGSGAGRQAAGLRLFRDGFRLDVLAFGDRLASDLIGIRDLDSGHLLDAQEIGVLDDDGMAAFEALSAGFFILGQVGQALGAQGRGQTQDGDEYQKSLHDGHSYTIIVSRPPPVKRGGRESTPLYQMIR